MHKAEEESFGIEFLKFENPADESPEVLSEDMPEIYKWLVLLLEPDKEDDDRMDVVYHEAGIGDPTFFVENQIRAKSEGLIVKKCAKGFNLMVDFIKKFGEEEYASIIKRLNDDWRDLLNQQAITQ